MALTDDFMALGVAPALAEQMAAAIAAAPAAFNPDPLIMFGMPPQTAEFFVTAITTAPTTVPTAQDFMAYGMQYELAQHVHDALAAVTP